MCLQVRTKTVSQCIEFYYLSRKLLDKQKKLREENVDKELGQQKSVRMYFSLHPRGTLFFCLTLFLFLVQRRLISLTESCKAVKIIETDRPRLFVLYSISNAVFALSCEFSLYCFAIQCAECSLTTQSQHVSF